MEKRYHLSITSLLASTRGIHQELFFQTRLNAQRISQEECVVQLVVLNGVMLSCEIKETVRETLLFQREKAVDVLKPLGMLEWYRTSSQVYPSEGRTQQPLQPRQNEQPGPSPEQRYIPRRLNIELSLLDHSHRRIFLLVDGIRSVPQIAKLLGKPQEEVLSMLQDLQAQGCVIF